jgi:hypothetical protein
MMGRPAATTDDFTAQRCLAAGWELVQAKLGYGPSAADTESRDDDLKDFPLLGTIGPTDVVGEGQTTGGFYRRWSSKGGFLADLARYIVGNGRFAGGNADERTRALIMRLGDITTLSDLIRVASRADMADLADDPTFAFELQMWSIRRRYAWVQEALRASYTDATAEWTDAYSLVLRLYGLRPRSGFDAHRLTVVVSALRDGLAIRRGVDPDAVDDELFAEALVALLHGVVERDADPDGMTVVEAFDALVESDPQSTLAERAPAASRARKKPARRTSR